MTETDGIDPPYHYVSFNGHHDSTFCTEDRDLVLKFLEKEKHISACGQALVVSRDYRGSLTGPLPEELTGMRLAAHLGLGQANLLGVARCRQWPSRHNRDRQGRGPDAER